MCVFTYLFIRSQSICLLIICCCISQSFFQFIHFFQALTCLCLYVLRVGKLFIDLAQLLQYNVCWFLNTKIYHYFQCTVKCLCSGNCEIRKEVDWHVKMFYTHPLDIQQRQGRAPHMLQTKEEVRHGNTGFLSCFKLH